MKLRTVLAAALGAAVLAGIVGCQTGDDYARVCINRHTHERVNDRRCDRHDTDLAWWYVPSGYSAPPVGRRVDTAHGTTRRPTGVTVRRGVPARGARVGGTGARPANRAPAGGRPAPARPAPARPAPRIR